MNAYEFPRQLHTIWQDAVERYRAGQRGADTFFDAATTEALASIGLKPIDVYDFAEDFVGRDEPEFATFLMICEARRDYFLNVQKKQLSDTVLEMDALPAKDAEVDGIAWLPRIMPKAIGKLRGELAPEIMYCCGGDRRFFKEHAIHPAEFLRVAWAYEDDFDKIVEWVKARKAGTV